MLMTSLMWLQVHLDSAADVDAPHEEVMVDEEGEDEWCWEADFELTDDAVILPPIEQASEPMFFVCAAGSSGTARSLQGWEPLSELRPHWVWCGVEDGWALEANALISGVKARGADREEGEEGEEELAEDEDEDEDEGAAAREEAQRSLWKRMVQVAATGGAEPSAGEAVDEEEEEEEEEPGAQLEARGWRKLAADEMGAVLPEGRQLRPYQLEGLNWLRLHYYLGRNVILGDEMGLGKTAQTLALLQSLRVLEGVPGPFLIVAPLSTLPHWERELGLWTDAYAVTYHGPAEARQVRPRMALDCMRIAR